MTEETYYHYTSKKNANAIRRSEELKQSVKKPGPGRDDAIDGDGVYFTQVPPSAGKYEIAKNNYDGRDELIQHMVDKGKVNAYVEVKKSPELMRKVDPKKTDNRDVHIYEGDMRLDSSAKFGRVNKP